MLMRWYNNPNITAEEQQKRRASVPKFIGAPNDPNSPTYDPGVSTPPTTSRSVTPTATTNSRVDANMAAFARLLRAIRGY
jgi:hypothetical protein